MEFFLLSESKNAIVLSVETSGRVGSVAIGRGDSVLFESTFSGFMRHGAELFETLEGLLSKVGARPKDVGELYIAAGPGSFTGIRIAVTLAKMMSFAVGTRVIAVDTLDCLAENATDYIRQTGSELKRVATILDAKQGRFFSAIFEWNGQDWIKVHPSNLLYPEELLSLIDKDGVPVGLLGEGLVFYADKFKHPLTTLIDNSFWSATARGVYAVGQRMAAKNRFSDIYTLVPTYIRKPDAVEKRKNMARESRCGLQDDRIRH